MSNALVVTDNKKLPAHVTAAQGGGRGNEDVGAEHLTIPRIKLLQKMSDEVDKHHDNYVEGAEVGDFINNLTLELYGGTMYVMNIKFTEDFVVWRKREAGGGFLGSFKSEAEANARIAEEEKPGDYDVTQTHSHIMVILDPETGEPSRPVSMDFNSSKLRVSRNWNTQIGLRGGDRFSGVWALKSKQTQNRAGNAFMTLEVDWVGWATDENYKMAEGYYESFQNS